MKTNYFKISFNYTRKLSFVALLFFTININGQTLVKDIDGNEYSTKILKDQVWLTNNLKVTRFRNGDTIKQAKTYTEWVNAGKKEQPVWCYYNFDPNNDSIYGKLYSWHAVKDNRGLAPIDWKIPSMSDWSKLTTSFSYASLKSDISPFEGSPGTNESGFDMVAGGGISDEGNFSLKKKSGIAWCSDQKNIDNAWFLFFNEYGVQFYDGPKEGGFSIRCLRENGLKDWQGDASLEQKKLNEKFGIDSVFDNRTNKSYPTMKFGNKYWMTKNLDVKTFRNGDPIKEVKTKEEWIKASENREPAWCYYENNKVNTEKYGILYNWYAVSDERGLSPEGYHIPTQQEIEDLENQINLKYELKHKVKSSDPTYSMKGRAGWTSVNNFELCDSGFDLMAGGCRKSDGSFYGIGTISYLWSSEDELKRTAWYQHVESISARIYSSDKGFGMSIRCVKD
jgi:uncharacterized protein (TIGR02145 family)